MNVAVCYSFEYISQQWHHDEVEGEHCESSATWNRVAVRLDSRRYKYNLKNERREDRGGEKMPERTSKEYIAFIIVIDM